MSLERDGLQACISEASGIVTIAFSGVFDATNADFADGLLTVITAFRPPGVIVDVEQVEVLTGAALDVVARAGRGLQDSGGWLRVLLPVPGASPGAVRTQ